MAEVVIKIPEKLVEWIDEYYKVIRGFEGERIGIIIEAIKNGIALPEGHGRLIDENEVGKYVIIGRADLRKCPTIIEADKSVK